MAYLCVILLSVGFLFIFPTIVWGIDLPTLFDMLDQEATGAKIEAFLKKYNVIENTSADFAGELILISFAYTIIFFVMALLIATQIRKRITIENKLKNISHKLDLLSKEK